MRRVERSMDMQGYDYALFETAILLEAKYPRPHQGARAGARRAPGLEPGAGEAKAEAERANQSKTRFLAAASHDLLQPLNAARLFLSALSETECHPRARQLIGSTEAAFELIERLLASLLDISKLDAGVMAAEPRDVPLGPLLRALAAEFAPLAERKGIELRAVPTSAVVRTDPDLLLRILRNLLSNAVRYTPEGRVLLGVRRRGGGLAVEVGDTGIGIRRSGRPRSSRSSAALGPTPTRATAASGSASRSSSASRACSATRSRSAPGSGAAPASSSACRPAARCRTRPSPRCGAGRSRAGSRGRWWW